MTLQDLKDRNIINNTTNEQKLSKAIQEGSYIYCGFDPSAASLHLGNFCQIIALLLFSKVGLKPICVLGTGTGMVGDPSGKNTERNLLDKELLMNNSKFVEEQLVNLTKNKSLIVKNGDWLNKISFLDFLRDIGKYINVSYMINKEQVNRRIETGISYTEFSYMILQSYDFYHLYKNNNCRVQIGGSDQWGNITAGIEFIRKIVGEEKNETCGVTFNLLTKDNGEKFGKSESGAIWLDANKTSPFEMYQFLLNQPDSLVAKLLYSMTLLENNEIEKIITEHGKNPSSRIAQLKLAHWIVEFIHGTKNLNIAKDISNYLFKFKFENLLEKDLNNLFLNIKQINSNNKDENLSNVLLNNDVFSSKRELNDFLKNGAIKINGIMQKTDIIFQNLPKLFSKFIIISKGKKEFYIYKLI